MQSMQIDLEGFVQSNIQLSTQPRSRCLLPIYEAIMNSIHAILERNKKTEKALKGHIEVRLERDKSQGVLKPEENQNSQLHPIQNVVVIDNGVGFDSRNFESFNTAFSRKKKELGAKGRGRFVWLKVYDRVEIESVFEELGVMKRRKFAFTLSDGAIGGEEVEDVEAKPLTPKSVCLGCVNRINGFTSETLNLLPVISSSGSFKCLLLGACLN